MGDEEEDDNQEIGVKGEQQEHEEGTEGEAGEKKPYNKDYKNNKRGNYKKDWKKGEILEVKKNFLPPAPRTKNERGDYVVTNFVIPDRASKKEA